MKKEQEKKKKSKWPVITRISLLNVIGVYRLLEKQRGQMAAPGRSRALCDGQPRRCLGGSKIPP